MANGLAAIKDHRIPRLQDRFVFEGAVMAYAFIDVLDQFQEGGHRLARPFDVHHLVFIGETHLAETAKFFEQIFG